MGTAGKVYPQYITTRPDFADLDPRQSDVFKIIEREYTYAEFKYDGQWGRMEIQPSGSSTNVYIFSRHGQLKHSFIESRILPFTGRTVIHGEFMHGSNWGIRTGRDKHFYAFDVVMHNGVDVSFEHFDWRRGLIEGLAAQLHGGWPWFFASRLIPLTQGALGIWAEVEAEGFEGAVFKRAGCRFGDGWARMKREFEVDYVCLGFEQSDAAKYKGRMVKSIIAGLYVEGVCPEICRISGLDEAERAAFYNSPGLYVGKAFTARGKLVFPSGSMRHSEFKCFRGDKLPQACTLEAALKVGGLK